MSECEVQFVSLYQNLLLCKIDRVDVILTVHRR